jgi:hypothetical protein
LVAQDQVEEAAMTKYMPILFVLIVGMAVAGVDYMMQMRAQVDGRLPVGTYLSQIMPRLKSIAPAPDNAVAGLATSGKDVPEAQVSTLGELKTATGMLPAQAATGAESSDAAIVSVEETAAEEPTARAPVGLVRPEPAGIRQPVASLIGRGCVRKGTSKFCSIGSN